MTLYQPEPVEISTRMRPGEWTEDSLAALTASYRDKLQRMGAAPSEIDVVTDRDDGGGVSVVATWLKPAVAQELREEPDRSGLLAMKPDDEPLRQSAQAEPLQPSAPAELVADETARDEPAP